MIKLWTISLIQDMQSSFLYSEFICKDPKFNSFSCLYSPVKGGWYYSHYVNDNPFGGKGKSVHSSSNIGRPLTGSSCHALKNHGFVFFENMDVVAYREKFQRKNTLKSIVTRNQW